MIEYIIGDRRTGRSSKIREDCIRHLYTNTLHRAIILDKYQRFNLVGIISVLGSVENIYRFSEGELLNNIIRGYVDSEGYTKLYVDNYNEFTTTGQFMIDDLLYRFKDAMLTTANNPNVRESDIINSIGFSPRIKYRMLDVYGNFLPDNSVFDILYNHIHPMERMERVCINKRR